MSEKEREAAADLGRALILLHKARYSLDSFCHYLKKDGSCDAWDPRFIKFTHAILSEIDDFLLIIER